MDTWEKEMREKSKRGELTLEDMKQIVSHFSQGRRSAIYAAAGAKKGKTLQKETKLQDDFWEGLGESTESGEAQDSFEGL